MPGSFVGRESNELERIGMTAYLSCNITRGQLAGEWAVRGAAHAGVEFSLFAPHEFVRPVDDGADDAGQERPGLLFVEVLAEDQDRALVELPVPTFDNGQIITVDRGQIQAVG